MSKASVDLPEPDTPVTTVMPSRGIVHVDVAQVVLARLVHDDRVARAVGDAAVGTGATVGGDAADRAASTRCTVALVLAERAAGMRRGAAPSRPPACPPRRAAAAGLAALGTEVEDPVRRADHVEVVLDDDQRVTCLEQALERTEQLRDVVEMQSGRRLVEQEQRRRRPRWPSAPIRRGVRPA